MSKIDVFSKFEGQAEEDVLYEFACFNYYNYGYSLFNSALILLQKPGATFVKTERAWNMERRFVNPNAAPLIILQPRGPVMLVYDRSDTYGKENKIISREEMKKRFDKLSAREIGGALYVKMLERLSHIGILYEERNYGERRYGATASLDPPGITVYYKRNRARDRVEVPAYYQISVNSAGPYHEKALTLFHELAHIYCGHLKGTKTPQNALPELRSVLSESAEYEAESVCKLLCKRFALFNDSSDEYLKQYCVNGVAPPHSVTAIVSAADKIIKLLCLHELCACYL